MDPPKDHVLLGRADFQGLLVTLSKDELQKPLKMMIGYVAKMKNKILDLQNHV